MDLALYLGLPMMIGGLIAWMIAAELAKSWLKKNDPYYEPPSKVVQLFIGGLFSAIGPVRQYARQRRSRAR